ncbi:MAG: extracellular solute-binding protein [Sphaerochaetaceae bacterium]|nr:extracellular solute-binding protein [Sphaerochaetaceae bacterium]
MKKYRILSLLTVLVILFTFGPVAVFAQGSAESATGVTEIELWHRWSGAHQKIFQEMVDKFNATNESVKINAVSIPGQYADLLSRATAQVAAGEDPPAIIAPGYYLLEHTVNTFGGADLAKVGGAEAAKVFSQFEPALLGLGNVNGVQYGIPLAVSIQSLFYNADIFVEAGLDPNTPPKTWEEVIEYAKIIKNKTNKKALFISTPDSWYMSALLESNGAPMLANGKASFANDNGVEVMKMWRQMYVDGLIPQISYAESQRAFQAGEIAMHGISIMNLSAMSGTMGDALMVAPMPSFGDKAKKQPAGGAGLIITATKAKQQAAAWEFFKFVGTKEAMDIWSKSGYVSVVAGYAPKSDPRQQAAYDQLGNAISWTNWPGPRGLEAEGIIQEWRDRILAGNVSAQEGLRNAANSINSIIGN